MLIIPVVGADSDPEHGKMMTMNTMNTPRTLLILILGLAGLLISGCGNNDGAWPESTQDNSTATSSETPDVNATDPEAEKPPLVVFLGDSLTAGYGLDEEQAFPALVESRLEAAGQPIRMVNAGISGDTTAGGLNRLDWLLSQQPDILVVSLGANDGLRGVELTSSEENLRQIVTKAKEKGVKVLLVGMLIPPNYGPDYTEQFAAIYPKLAEELDVALLPFLLEGVAADPELNLADGIHPNAEGHEILATTVLQHLTPLLDGLDAEG